MTSYEEEDFEQANDLVKTRQRYFRRPKQAANLLSRLMARKGYTQTNTQSQLDKVWAELIGEDLASKTKVGQIRRGKLEIQVSNSTLNQQLLFQKRKLLSELQEKLPKHNIKDLGFRVGKIV